MPHFRRLTLHPQSTPVEPVLNLYKSSVFFLDQLLGQVFKTLENEEWMENSIIFVTADHGQEVNKLKRGDWEHLTNFSDWQMRVPFVLHWPNKKAKNLSSVTSHIDVVPTLMQDLFGCKNPIQDYSSGKNLFHSVNQKRHLFIFTWFNEQVILTGKEIYSFDPKEIKILDSLTYKEKKEKSENLTFLFKLITKQKKQFL